jgi:hypothetical protein
MKKTTGASLILDGHLKSPWIIPMKKVIILLTILSLPISILCAEEEDDSNAKTSNLTPNAPKPVNMANPNKPAWLAEPHGK